MGFDLYVMWELGRPLLKKICRFPMHLKLKEVSARLAFDKSLRIPTSSLLHFLDRKKQVHLFPQKQEDLGRVVCYCPMVLYQYRLLIVHFLNALMLLINWISRQLSVCLKEYY